MPQIATKSTHRQRGEYSPSGTLWDVAYDSLRDDTDNAKYVIAYEATLVKVLAGRDITDEISNVLKDRCKRKEYMTILVRQGKEKVSRTSKIMAGLGAVAEFILSATEMIDLAVQNIPQAALPCAGICIGLQVSFYLNFGFSLLLIPVQILLNPAKATKSNLAGITHVVSRMDWYCALSELLLDQAALARGTNSFEKVLELLQTRVVSLYKALLLYQMKSACSYYRNQGLAFFRDLMDLEHWDSSLKDVTDAEAAVETDLRQYIETKNMKSLCDLVHLGEAREGKLGNIHQSLDELINSQKAMHADDEKNACLQALYVVNPRDEIARIENKNEKLIFDASKWILGTPEYAAFTGWEGVDESASPLLWIKGNHGTGKTMLLIGIIRELSKQSAALAPSVSYFFCQDTDGKGLSGATSVLRSLIWMFLIQQPCLISHLQNEYKCSGAALFSDGNEFFALERVFKKMLNDPYLSPVYMIVDALDECDQANPGLDELVQLISTSFEISKKVKWLVSSRLGIGPGKIKHAREVKLNDRHLKAPVDAYIKLKLANLKGSEGYTDDILDGISKEVNQRAESTFLWVALAFKVLKTVDGGKAISCITKMPPGLTDLYNHMMTRIENTRSTEPQYYEAVLAIAVLAFQPLSPSEIAVFAGLEQDEAKKALGICGSFLTTTEHTIKFIHQSAKEHLGNYFERKLQSSGICQSHLNISRHSIEKLKELRKNMYCLQDFGLRQSNGSAPKPDPLADFRYYCIFWANHLCSSGVKCSTELLQDDGPVHLFLKENFLPWIESLSLMGRVSDAVQSIMGLLRSNFVCSWRLECIHQLILSRT